MDQTPTTLQQTLDEQELVLVRVKPNQFVYERGSRPPGSTFKITRARFHSIKDQVDIVSESPALGVQTTAIASPANPMQPSANLPTPDIRKLTQPRKVKSPAQAQNEAKGKTKK
jgi:hypothetical protein